MTAISHRSGLAAFGRIRGLIRLLPLLGIISVLAGCAARDGLNMQAEDAQVSKSIDVPVAVPLAIYVPEEHLELRFFVDSIGAWITPGEALRSAIDTAGVAYFTEHYVIDARYPADKQVGLVAVFNPEWEIDGGKIALTMKYRVHDAMGTEVATGEVTRSRPIGSFTESSGFYNAALKTSQVVLVKTINNVLANGNTVADRIPMSAIGPDLLVNMDKPVRTGTAFFVSGSGQLFTAAHVIDGCLRTQIEYDGDSHRVDLLGESALLDVALLQSPVSTDHYLALRADPDIVLGERVSAAGFPLTNVLANSANLTVGNVSSLKALPGSMGKYQFSAPVQPGSSGGPVVSEKGELIGMTTGTLNVKALIDKGVVPQNINFALEPKHLARFADKHSADIARFDGSQGLTDVGAVNEHLVASVAQVTCYQ